MPRFRLRSDQPSYDLFFPQGHFDSLHVEPGDVIDVPGEVADDSPEDAYVTGTDDDARAWPKALWELADTLPSTSESAPADAAPAV